MFGVIRKTPRDPWMEVLYNLERRMGRVFNEPFGTFDWPVGEVTTAAWTPVVDILEAASRPPARQASGVFLSAWFGLRAIAGADAQERVQRANAKQRGAGNHDSDEADSQRNQGAAR